MGIHHHPFAPEPEAEEQRPWEPQHEREIEARQHQEAQAHEPDHGRHGEDRSRPSTVVRKTR